MRTEHPDPAAGRHRRQRDDVETEPVQLFGQGGEHHRTTADGGVEDVAQTAEGVFQDLGEEVLVPHRDPAPGPGIPDLLEQRRRPLA